MYEVSFIYGGVFATAKTIKEVKEKIFELATKSSENIHFYYNGIFTAKEGAKEHRFCLSQKRCNEIDLIWYIKEIRRRARKKIIFKKIEKTKNSVSNKNL